MQRRLLAAVAVAILIGVAGEPNAAAVDPSEWGADPDKAAKEGRAAFEATERSLAAYEKIIRACGGKKEDWLRSMEAALGRQLSFYAGIVSSYRDTVWGIAAQYRLGYLRDRYATSLRSCMGNPWDEKCRKGSGDAKRAACEERDKWKLHVEAIVAPGVEAALRDYTTAVERARDLKLTKTTWAKLAAAAVKRLGGE